MGPILFLPYSNDLLFVVTDTSLTVYTDDNTLLMSDKKTLKVKVGVMTIYYT